MLQTPNPPNDYFTPPSVPKLCCWIQTREISQWLHHYSGYDYIFDVWAPHRISLSHPSRHVDQIFPRYPTISVTILQRYGSRPALLCIEVWTHTWSRCACFEKWEVADLIIAWMAKEPTGNLEPKNTETNTVPSFSFVWNNGHVSFWWCVARGWQGPLTSLWGCPSSPG